MSLCKCLCYALLLASLILCIQLPLWAGKTRPASTLDSGYVPALAAADRFLQAWQSGDREQGMALLTSHAKKVSSTETMERFFSGSTASAYEIGRGKWLKRGRYEFPIVLVTSAKNNPRRRFLSVVIVNTGNNDWAVDKLP
jgi:hypothetical protein